MKLSDLDKLIPYYAENKTKLDAVKKLCDAENRKIKNIMLDFSVQHYTAGGYTVTCTTSKRETLNEDVLLGLEHLHAIPGIIKTKEYVDFDALEKAIYDGKIPPEVLAEMDKAKESKTVATLRVKREKGE